MTRSKKLVRTIIVLAAMLLFAAPAQSQFLKKLGKAAERAAARTVENRVEQETQEKTDAALDSILEPGSRKNENTPLPDKQAGDPNENTTDNTSKPIDENQSIPNDDTPSKELLTVYSKFDFVAGDKQLFFDDFSSDFIGDFPAKWNTDGGGEVVTIGDTKWFEMKMSSYYIPDVGQLPEEYTIEFDIFTTGTDKNTSSQAMLHVILDESDGFGYGKNAVYAYLPFCQYVASSIRMWGRDEGEVIVDNRISVDVREIMKNNPHISVAVNKQRFRLWINEKKYIDIPRIVPTGKISTFKMEPSGFKDGKEQLFITNVKVAEGGVDLRRKLISEGKISTNGILFESGSAKLKAESMGIIRQIYQVLQQDASISLKIVGHTDSDGGDESNLKLSKQRADAVKNALATIYSIDENRLSTEGKGETEPIAENDNAEGKAQNRRVEFIKQ